MAGALPQRPAPRSRIDGISKIIHTRDLLCLSDSQQPAILLVNSSLPFLSRIRFMPVSQEKISRIDAPLPNVLEHVLAPSQRQPAPSSGSQTKPRWRRTSQTVFLSIVTVKVVVPRAGSDQCRPGHTGDAELGEDFR